MKNLFCKTVGKYFHNHAKFARVIIAQTLRTSTNPINANGQQFRHEWKSQRPPAKPVA
jgi:hypothetical protein